MKIDVSNLMGGLGFLLGSVLVFLSWYMFDFNPENIIGKLLIVLGIVSAMGGGFLIFRSLDGLKIKLSRYEDN